MNHALLVAVGGAIGSVGRHYTGLLMLRLMGPNFPYGTLTVNVLGSFVMGVFVELLARVLGGSTELRLFFATGVLGGYTTLSSFSLDTAVLWERGAVLPAAAYVIATVAVSVLALFAGMWLVRSLG